MSQLPDVSIVLITYNDEARLERALLSLRHQTLRNLEIIVVDDASTDGTAALVGRHIEQDSRVTYLRMEHNSGGCSAPRNTGMRVARAPWIMFCDSDDEYERHACKNLLLAAERMDADVVCGMTERVDARTGKVKAWRPEVHQEEIVADGLKAFPDLLFDTISVNKIYRRSLIEQYGLTFPEGLLFEDQLFTLQAMAFAERVGVIPQVVYRWYVDRLTEDLSITQRRAEVRNVESRVEINRRIDAFLESRGFDEVKATKDVKFLRHDLHLYFASILDADDDISRALMDRLEPYVREMDLRAAWKIRPLSKVAIYHLLIGDLDHLRDAMTFLRWASVVSTPVRDIDGRQIWCCGHENDGPDVAGIPVSEWLDVSSLDLIHVPFVERRYLHQVTKVEQSGARVAFEGWTFDYRGDLDMSHISGSLALLSDKAGAVGRMKLTWLGQDGARLMWRAEGPIDVHLWRPLTSTDRGAIAIEIECAGLVNVTSTRFRVEGPFTFPFPGDPDPFAPDVVGLVQHDRGGLGWKAERSPEVARRYGRRQRHLRNPLLRVVLRGPAVLAAEVLAPLVGRVGRWMPRKNIVICPWSTDGRLALIADSMVASDSRLSVVRTAADGALVPVENGSAVQPKTIRLAWWQARARFRLDDGTGEILHGGGAVFTGAGPALTRVGLDDPAMISTPGGARTVRSRGRSWDLALASGPADARAIRSAWNFKGPVVEMGLPEVPVADTRTLGLPDDRPIVVYAPAPRGPGNPLLFDVDAWNLELGRTCYLVICTDDEFEVPTRLRSAVRIASSQVTDFITAATLVVADYGPSVGWASALDKPLVLFQPDRDDYIHRRHGLYVDVDELAPLTQTQIDLMREVTSTLHEPAQQQPYLAARKRFVADWCGSLRGTQAARVAAAAIMSGTRRSDS